jgi:hypothetical protein
VKRCFGRRDADFTSFIAAFSASFVRVVRGIVGHPGAASALSERLLVSPSRLT